jgi:formylglycine-generating enzyme required for sulfatase activity
VRDFSDDELLQLPVERVSWDDVQDFVAKLNALTAREKQEEGWGYRLPTEEEWEYAARSPVPSESSSLSMAHCALSYYHPRPSNSLSPEEANYWGRWVGNQDRTSKVGAYPPNGLGVHDLHGNVWEWTHTSSEAKRVIRGGGWNVPATNCTVASRDTVPSNLRSEVIGFRLVRVQM